MLSRVANSIYWMNRYIERAENYARFIDVNINLTLDMPPQLDEQWMPLIYTTGDKAFYEEQYGESYTKDNVIKFMAYDEDNPNSIYNCLKAARENARSIREIISSEMWIQINELYLLMSDKVKTFDPDNPEDDFFRHIKLGSHLFQGIMDSTYLHSEGWHWGKLGRSLERADKTARVVDMKYYFLLPSIKDVGTPLDLIQWAAMLKSISAFEMYRKTHGKLDVANIISFLTFNSLFPRAIYSCVLEAEKSLHAITNSNVTEFTNPAEKEMGKLRSQLNFDEVKDIYNFGIHEYFDNLQLNLNNVGHMIHETYISAKDQAV